jgi:hypothetical protein
MRMDQLLDDAQHWYARAEQTLAIVPHIHGDPEARAILQKIAAEYERLARHAEQRTRYAIRDDNLGAAQAECIGADAST